METMPAIQTFAKPGNDTVTVQIPKTAYHGGTEAVTAPGIRDRLHAPDFGKGFYTTASKEQAVRWAKRVRLERVTMGGYDKIDYAVNIVEAYRQAKGLSGAEVARIFGDAGVFKFLEDFGDTLHCQSDNATIAEIDDFIKTQTP